jgi:hypothetical protein
VLQQCPGAHQQPRPKGTGEQATRARLGITWTLNPKALRPQQLFLWLICKLHTRQSMVVHSFHPTQPNPTPHIITVLHAHQHASLTCVRYGVVCMQVRMLQLMQAGSSSVTAGVSPLPYVR